VSEAYDRAHPLMRGILLLWIENAQMGLIYLGLGNKDGRLVER